MLNVGGEVAAPAVNEVEVEEVEKVEVPAENAEVEEVEAPVASGAYVVEAGDTLYSIARATGVSIDELKALNGLSSDLIIVGQVLVLEGSVEEVEVVEENNDVEAVEEDNVVVEEVTEEVEVAEETEEVQSVNEEAEAEVKAAAQAVKEAERAEQERVEAERAEAAQAVAEAERAEQERVEAERAAAAKAVEEAERAEQERVAAERAAAEQAEAERLAAERAEAKRAAQAVAEAERAEQERLAAEQEAQQTQQAEQQNQPAASAPVNNASQNFAGQTNHYLYGWCAWYAFEQRAALGKPVSNMWGDANNWAASASADGFTVSNSPSVGAIAQSYAGSNGAGGSGHVAIVESIHGDGSITVSEMGWNGSVGTATYRTIPASQVSSHNFIH